MSRGGEHLENLAHILRLHFSSVDMLEVFQLEK
jgi:hypothetical protein